MEPVAGMTVSVSRAGWMEFSLAPQGTQLLCGGIGAAMWIALRQHSWNAGAAAAVLAPIWEVDPWELRAEMTRWIGELYEAGLLEN